MAEIEGIPLWVYKPSVSVDHRGRVSAFNVYVILGFKEEFVNIRSKVPSKVQVGSRVFGEYISKVGYVAEVISNSPDEFLKRCIGTTNRQSEQYKKFKEECDKYKAYIMERRLTDEHAARSQD